MAISIDTIIKVADIQAHEISEETQKFFEDSDRTRYADDSELGEDMYSAYDILGDLDPAEIEALPEIVRKEVGEIEALCAREGCSYVRFTFI